MQSVGAGMKRKTKPGSALPPQHLNKGRRRASGKEFLYDVVNNVMSGPAAMPAPNYTASLRRTGAHKQRHRCVQPSQQGYATVCTTKQGLGLAQGLTSIN